MATINKKLNEVKAGKLLYLVSLLARSVKPIKRISLMRKLKITDYRYLKILLHEARMRGVPICNDMDGKGYYIGGANEIEKRLKVLRKLVKGYNQEIKSLKRVLING